MLNEEAMVDQMLALIRREKKSFVTEKLCVAKLQIKFLFVIKNLTAQRNNC